MNMKKCINNAVLLSLLVLAACVSTGRYQTKPMDAAVESIYTDLNAASCQKTIDPDDPNSTPYQRCPGVSGYALALRHVGSGRQSIDVITPTQEVFPLDYHDVVTRHMTHVDDKAEWRAIMKNGIKTPFALSIRIHAHENPDEPEQVTRTVIALAKITADEICVTDTIPTGSLSSEEVRMLADSVRDRDCLTPLPELVSD